MRADTAMTVVLDNYSTIDDTDSDGWAKKIVARRGNKARREYQVEWATDDDVPYEARLDWIWYYEFLNKQMPLAFDRRTDKYEAGLHSDSDDDGDSAPRGGRPSAGNGPRGDAPPGPSGGVPPREATP